MAAKASFKMFQGHHLQSDVVFNQVINTTNKSPPYKLNLNRGFTPGCEITVTGTCKPGVDGFAINLCTNSDIAFHFNPRFKAGAVVRNSKRNGRWETEERDGFLPIHPGQQFILSIVCENDEYKVSINGSYFTYFKHRMSTGLVNRLETTNDNFFVNQITYQALLAGKGSPASSGCRIELQHGFSSGSELAITGMAQAYQESCQPGFEFRNKPVIKFGKIGDTPAVRNLLQKRNVVHWGSDDTSTFSIDFESSVPGQSAEKLFTFCPLFREGVVERSSFVGGRWGLKERDGGLPFRMGVTFHLQFKCEPEGFKIYTDGNLFAFFKHRHPNTAITHVNFTGSIVFSKVDYHTQLESIGLNPNEKKWYGEPDMKELDKKQYGQPDYKESESRWHGGALLYPNLEDSVTKGISQLGRDWESGSNGLNLSRSKSSFDISSEPHKQPRRNRNRQHRRPNRSHTPDPTYTKSLIQINFQFIQEFDCDWRSSPYKLLLNQGFEPGSEITILGSIPYEFDREGLISKFMLRLHPEILFQVNLMKHNGDIMFHFAPRFYEGVIVRNTRIMSTWGVEGRDEGIPISIGDQFTVNIHSEQDAYRVFINNSFFTKFMHRAGGPVAYLDIQDEVSINNIVYQCAMKTHGPNIPLEKGFYFGSEVTLFGQIEPNRDRFSVDLEAPGSITDILFHIEIRWRDGLAVLNSFLNGYWGHEQLERGISLYPGTSVKIRVKGEADGYQVFVNDTYLALYRQGHGAREVRNLAIRGGFKLNMLKYCSKI